MANDESKPPVRSRKWVRRVAWVVGISLAVVLAVALFADVKYAYLPGDPMVAARPAQPTPAYDLWGESFSEDEAQQLLATEEGRRRLSPENGAVRIDPAMLKLGREAFYRETFGNEFFLTDVLGLTAGPLSRWQYIKALAALGGRGTTNLRVELAESITIGDKTWEKGELIDTGLDVPKGAFVPMGLAMFYSHGRMREGITCALCHSTLDPETLQVVEGAPNNDLNAGIMLAMAPNSAAYFTHAQIDPHQLPRGEQVVTASDGGEAKLPDAKELERLVDESFIHWPRGNFDSTIDMVSNPAQIPDSFTQGDHPYGWSGFGMAGPFRGLTALSNNVHAQNSDSLTQTALSKEVFDLDPEVYLGMVLQNSARSPFRFDPSEGRRPSEFFSSVDPTPRSPGINEVVLPPEYPKVSLAIPDGVMVGTAGYRFSEQNNAMAAWQNTLLPPAGGEIHSSQIEQGRQVFERARCSECHSGPALTNNRVVSVKELGVEPTRARSFAKTQPLFDPTPTVWAYDSPTPIGEEAKALEVPTDHFDEKEIELAWAQNDSPGGYKTPSLIGLLWGAPYLHDGGVAVGRDLADVGVPGTWQANRPPDPANSLRALIDRNLRQKVTDANAASPGLAAAHVQGVGHAYWIDAAAGFSADEQQAVIEYLLHGAGKAGESSAGPLTAVPAGNRRSARR